MWLTLSGGSGRGDGAAAPLARREGRRGAVAVTLVSHVVLNKPEPADQSPGRETAFSRGADLEHVWSLAITEEKVANSVQP